LYSARFLSDAASTSPIGGERIRAYQQGDVIMLVRIFNCKYYLDPRIEALAIAAFKVFFGLEDDFVRAISGESGVPLPLII